MSRNRLLDENAVCLYKMDRDGAAREEDFYRAAYELLKAVRPDVGKRVVMKPNVTVPAEPDSGIITHPTFVRGIVAYLEEVGVRIEDMVIAEGGGSGPPAHSMAPHFQTAGYEALVREKGIRLVNTNVDEPVEIEIAPPIGPSKKMTLSKTVWGEGRYVISVPKMKSHWLPKVTLCMKNLMGSISPIGRRHFCQQARPEHLNPRDGVGEGDYVLWQEKMAEKLCELSLAVQPDLHLVEGVVGREGTGFHRGRNFETHLAALGTNAVAVDAVLSFLMGNDPEKLSFLRKAAQWGLGTNRLSEIAVYELRDGEMVSCRPLGELAFRPPFQMIRGRWG